MNETAANESWQPENPAQLALTDLHRLLAEPLPPTDYERSALLMMANAIIRRGLGLQPTSPSVTGAPTAGPTMFDLVPGLMTNKTPAELSASSAPWVFDVSQSALVNERMRLAEAAPDLLAALVKWLAVHDGNGPRQPDCDYDFKVCEVLTNARAAIAKATGKPGPTA